MIAWKQRFGHPPDMFSTKRFSRFGFKSIPPVQTAAQFNGVQPGTPVAQLRFTLPADIRRFHQPFIHSPDGQGMLTNSIFFIPPLLLSPHRRLNIFVKFRSFFTFFPAKPNQKRLPDPYKNR
jgi:hypothetical protein